MDWVPIGSQQVRWQGLLASVHLSGRATRSDGLNVITAIDAEMIVLEK